MIRLRLALLAAAALVVGLALPAAAVASAAPAAASGVDRAAATQLLGLLNQHRRSVGVPPLRSDSALTAIAEGWTLQMAASNNLSHNMALFSSASHARLGIAFLGENVALTSGDVARANQNFINSPHHRENMENRRFVLVGLAVVKDAQGITWVTEDFGGPRATARAAAPAPRPVATHRSRPVRQQPASPPAVHRPSAVVHHVARPVARPPLGHQVAARLANRDTGMTRLPAIAAVRAAAWSQPAAAAHLDGPATLAAGALFLSSGSGLLVRRRARRR